MIKDAHFTTLTLGPGIRQRRSVSSRRGHITSSGVGSSLFSPYLISCPNRPPTARFSSAHGAHKAPLPSLRGRGAMSYLAPRRQSRPPTLSSMSFPSSRLIDVRVLTLDSAVGAGDTFVAGILYKLTVGGRQRVSTLEVDDDTAREALTFAVDLATRKIQMDGFQGLV